MTEAHMLYWEIAPATMTLTPRSELLEAHRVASRVAYVPMARDEPRTASRYREQTMTPVGRRLAWMGPLWGRHAVVNAAAADQAADDDVLAEVATMFSSLRVVAVSDTHEAHWRFSVPPGDVFIHAGDILICNSRFTVPGTIAKLRDFNCWLGTLPHRHKIIIAGNHDHAVEALGSANEVRKLLTNAVFLCNEFYDIVVPRSLLTTLRGVGGGEDNASQRSLCDGQSFGVRWRCRRDGSGGGGGIGIPTCYVNEVQGVRSEAAPDGSGLSHPPASEDWIVLWRCYGSPYSNGKSGNRAFQPRRTPLQGPGARGFSLGDSSDDETLDAACGTAPRSGVARRRRAARAWRLHMAPGAAGEEKIVALRRPNDSDDSGDERSTPAPGATISAENVKELYFPAASYLALHSSAPRHGTTARHDEVAFLDALITHDIAEQRWIKEFMSRVPTRVHVAGHMHEHYGVSGATGNGFGLAAASLASNAGVRASSRSGSDSHVFHDAQCGAAGVAGVPGMTTLCVTACSLNGKYRATNPPIVWDMATVPRWWWA